MAACSVALPEDESIYVSAVVRIKNLGTRNTRLPFENGEPFTVRAVHFDETGRPLFAEPERYNAVRAGLPSESIRSIVVRSGGSEEIPFFFRVPSRGLYFLAFGATLTSEEGEIAQEVGALRPTRWVARTFLVV